jgi:hypothetical protein
MIMITELMEGSGYWEKELGIKILFLSKGKIERQTCCNNTSCGTGQTAVRILGSARAGSWGHGWM